MALIMSKNKLTMSLNLVLVLCLFLIISFAEGKQLGTIPRCQKVYGVEAGDTCNGIMQKFKLNAEFFAINPNINCNSIFVGQWLCIAGTAK
ncbi:hypothetical protein Pyn_39205 [Prunus yedoensis var. nudiflora]|uniref:LysM domain-containing protein n=1 Tax=Prunus yedoensis var. nudiflora TaxID=2094558 RepID=A0A314Z7H1_PRUYE|nr:hypothetical protein Pyn_39205 [Prunus yedoensis var. nudiflora]